MASKVQIILEDDIDGSQASETITFALDGVTYEIDLNEEHASQLRDAVAPWAASARRVGGRQRRGQKPASTDQQDNHAIRAWAQEHGIEVSARGRIAASVRDAYAAAVGN